MLEALLQDWYFHLPNYILAIMMYSALGRLALMPFLRPGTSNYIFRAFVWLSGPAVALASLITPRALPFMVVVIFAALWCYVLRVALLLGLTLAGMAPTGV